MTAPSTAALSGGSTAVREHARIGDDQVIMICVAMGWPDDSFAANAVVSRRKSVDDAAVFVGFDDRTSGRSRQRKRGGPKGPPLP